MEERNEISVELSALSALVGGISRQTPYRVPVGYFDQLPAIMMSRITAGSSTLPVAASTFQVPEGYFDGFASQVLARIKGGEHPNGGECRCRTCPPFASISRITRVTPYQVPEGYFEELSPVLTVAARPLNLPGARRIFCRIARADPGKGRRAGPLPPKVIPMERDRDRKSAERKLVEIFLGRGHRRLLAADLQLAAGWTRKWAKARDRRW